MERVGVGDEASQGLLELFKRKSCFTAMKRLEKR